uniref:Uncharacterized protein n=1 Tax=Sarcophilus harrisii TaxID=9305 RepID=A0A7N4NLJ0_SARHA
KAYFKHWNQGTMVTTSS